MCFGRRCSFDARAQRLGERGPDGLDGDLDAETLAEEWEQRDVIGLRVHHDRVLFRLTAHQSAGVGASLDAQRRWIDTRGALLYELDDALLELGLEDPRADG